jgi:ketosteroid isomerase-like protein
MNTLVKNLYKALDSKDHKNLERFFDEDIHFKFANAPKVIGKVAVLEANAAFFATINTMVHDIDNFYIENNTVICNGSVHYKRLDETEHFAVFATLLTVNNGLITDYLIYADVSGL